MSELRYRVVRADGTMAATFAGREPLDHACKMADEFNATAAGILAQRPYRVQGLVTCDCCGHDEWRDVPEPEPLPELPAQVWAYQWNGAGAGVEIIGFTDVQPGPAASEWASLRRVFVADVAAWREVTEDPR